MQKSFLTMAMNLSLLTVNWQICIKFNFSIVNCPVGMIMEKKTQNVDN